MKIHLVCHYFPPEIGAPQARLSEMARTWAARGHEVTVFTGFPNHPTGVIPKEYKGKFFLKEQQDGYTIYRHWLYATPNKGFLKKIIGHLSFMVTLPLFSLFRDEKPDVLLVSSPTFFSVFSVWLMSKLRKTPYVFEVRDLWPGIFVELGVLKNRLLIRILEAMEMFLYRQAALVTPVTHGFKDDIVRRGIASDQVEVVTNGVDLDFFDQRPEPADLTPHGVAPGSFTALYIGAHGLSHGLPSILEAAARLRREVTFLFVGEGAMKQQCQERAAEMGLTNVIFLPGVPREQVPGFYRAADVCLVPLKDSAGFDTFIPSKMFEIMACGRPIIGSLRGEAADILERSGGARVIAPEDPGQLVETLLNLKNNPDKCAAMSRNGRAFVQQHYNRERLAEQYLEYLERLL